jgi:lysyl-tRNA synthetase class 2
VDHTNDHWRPSASLQAIQFRAGLLARLRQYFLQQGVLEVETPLISSGTIPDPHIPSFSLDLHHTGISSESSCRYLNTSPEFAMKRLLAAGSGSVYQVCKAFRQGEQGRLHNPEFTLLEWYRVGFDHHQLMDDVVALIARLSDGLRKFEPEERLTYQAVFQRYLGLDPFGDIQGIIACARNQGIGPVTGLSDTDRDGWLDLLMGQCIHPRLGENRMTFVYDYPASQAALARISEDKPPVAERFELFIDGVELANGFHELQDVVEQRKRFQQELMRRKAAGLASVSLDEYFLESLEAGLPACSGVALGLDRLQLVLMGAKSLDEVIAFPFNRM